MKERRLLYAIGWVDDQYIEEMEEEQAVHHRSKRLLLLAAVIAVLMLLAGCVAVFNWLNSRSIGTETYTWSFDDQGHYQEPEQRQMQIMTFYGDEKSPIQKAMKEWYEFEQSYDQDGSLRWKNDDFTGLERKYETVYACYAQEMADKIDEIARKNGLKLLDNWVPFQSYQVDTAMEGAGIASLLRPDAKAVITNMAGMLFPPQNLDAEFSLKLTGADAAWTNRVIVGYTYARKDYLPDYGFYSWDTEGAQQWKYTSSDGTELLLAQGKTGGGIITAEQKDAYIIIDITEVNQNFPTPEEIMSREALEQFADVFDYHLVPQVIDAAAIGPKLDAAEEAYQAEQAAMWPVYDGFGDYLKDQAYYLSGGYFSFYDLNGDGEEELLLSRDGETIYDAVSNYQGEAIETGIGNGKVWLLENGGYLSYSQNTGVSQEYSIKAPYQEGAVVGWTFKDHHVEQYHYGETLYQLTHWKGAWAKRKLNGSWSDREPLSEEEVAAILAKYSRKTLAWTPIEDFPVDGSTLGEIWKQLDQETTPEKRLTAYSESVKRRLDRGEDITRYALHDLNGDGVEDLLLSWGSEEGFLGYTYRYGNLYTVESGATVLCENNVAMRIQKTSFGEYEEGMQYDIWRYVGRTKEPLASITYNQATDVWMDALSYTPLTEAEAQSILAKYPRIALEMRPISELIH